MAAGDGRTRPTPEPALAASRPAGVVRSDTGSIGTVRSGTGGSTGAVHSGTARPGHPLPDAGPVADAGPAAESAGARSVGGQLRARGPAAVVPVIARLRWPAGVRVGPRSAVVLGRAGDQLELTVTDVTDFPRQDGRSPRRVYVRARGAHDPDDRGWYVDQVRLRYDADARSATARLDLHPVMVRDARVVLLDVPGAVRPGGTSRSPAGP